jgi:chloramphenicol-sensitive protein RarD
MRKGILSTASAYILWGFFPIYFKILGAVSPIEIIGHRVAWRFLFLTVVLSLSHQWDWLSVSVKNRHALLIVLCAASLLAINWFTYIWAVISGFIVESSLGYFINPLFSILLGVLILRERLRPAQWVPVALATTGIVYLTYLYHRPPWIALVLALTFGTYGLIKKVSPLPSIKGLTMEMGTLFIPALVYLVYLELVGKASFGHNRMTISTLLAFSGVITAAPLLLFASGVRAIPLYLVGLLQYITPTLQFLIGVLIYGEVVTSHQLIGFSLVWLALSIYTLEAFIHKRRMAVYA